MPNSIDSHEVKRAILYCRVSGEEQRKKGYSLADQLDALRSWCSENRYEIVEEVQDAGYSGAHLERPGLHRVRKTVNAGGADAVVVLFRDRIARGVYAQFLAKEFREYGARLVALNSRSEDSPDGELGDNILDVIAAWERRKISERMNRGKRRKAQEGKVIAGPSPDYGFRYNETRDSYMVDEQKMSLIRRIFRMLGAEGATLNTVRRTIEMEGILAPSGRKGWSRQYLRTRIDDDVYLTRTFKEVSALVSPDVAASLDPSLSYGVWWYGKMRHTSTPMRTSAPDGTPHYKRARKSEPTPREEWIAVPVPDAGIPKEWVFAAREAVRDNQWCSNSGRKFWELTGGVIRCAECYRAMSVNYILAKNRGYYRCTGRYNGGVENGCSMSRTVRAEEAGARVWEFVSRLLTDPARLVHGLEKMLESERQSSVESNEASWLRRLSDTDRKQERLLDLHLEGDITTVQFRAKSDELREARATVEGQLEAVRSRLAHIGGIERDRNALVSHYASLVPQELDELSSQERNRIYKMMRLRVLADGNGELTADWGCNVSLTLPGSGRTRGR